MSERGFNDVMALKFRCLQPALTPMSTTQAGCGRFRLTASPTQDAPSGLRPKLTLVMTPRLGRRLRL
eukprot:CAMPEP_0170205424 /NCGR_PEP_ID=MMETSP0116_2-20130129/2254_1 /TAXON_ID=400756 /ORGANISM="Durinskia baltica, Strain CSIRO CS-38" /LENGTH=66 /DNA_ID=CAMNT_0010455811 /DNA_START=105 /DNA_END=301 /DNA_ORIENTATION=-